MLWIKIEGNNMKRWIGEIINQQEEACGFSITLATENQVIQFWSERRVLATWVSVILTDDARLVSWIPALPNDCGMKSQ